MFFQNLGELETNLYSTLRNAIRGGHNVSHLAEYIQTRLQKELGHDMKKVGHVSLVDTGGQTTFSGSGEIFEKFKKCWQLKDYSGFGLNPKTFFEEGFTTAPLRYMKFDETYHRMPYDCTNSMFLL